MALFDSGSLWGGRIRGGINYLSYPSPFFDVAGTYFPESVKELFQFCRYYYLTNPIIHAAINKVAVYPLTGLDYQEADEGLVNQWKHILEDILDYRKFQIGVSIERQVYGNALVSIGFPFVKKLVCKRCGYAEPVQLADYSYSGGVFRLKKCRHCGASGVADVVDEDTYAVDKLHLITWDVEHVTTEHNPISGETIYYYTVPDALANDIKTGKRAIIETTRQVFIDAVRERKSVILNKDNLFHMKRTSITAELGGWGIPRLLPVLRDAFGMQILRKAQEMISLEHAVPLRVLHPAPIGDAGVTAYQSLNLRQWKEEVGYELLKWRRDQNYIPILSLPIGYQELGGRAKVMMLAPEIRANAEILLAGLEVPVEFLFGGVQWSGSNVSLRMMENVMLGDIRDHLQLLKWIVKKISLYFDIPEIDIKFRRFKMADDLQRLALNLQMAQAGKLSDHTLLTQADYNPEEEYEQMEREADRRNQMARMAMMSQAKAQVEAQKLQLKAQAEAQRDAMKDQAQLQAQLMATQVNMQQQMAAGQQAEAPPSDGAKKEELRLSQATPSQQEVAEAQQPQQMPPVESLVSMIRQSPPDVARHLLQQLKEQNPDLFGQVLQLLRQQLASQQQVDTRPLPEQRPPRRQLPSV